MAAPTTTPAIGIEEGRRTTGLSAAALLGPATAFVVLGLLIPILILFRYSLNQYSSGGVMVDAVTGGNYIKFATDVYYRTVLITTLRVAFFCTVGCLVLGFPLAYVLARTQSRFKNILVMLVVLPLFVGNAVRAAGWMTFLGNKGLPNSLLISLGVLDRPLEIMFSEPAVLIGLIAINLPFMVLTLQSVIEGIDRAIEEAALSLGASPGTMFWKVLWPLALPGTVTGTILTFILAVNAYATPVLLGGPQFKMMAPLVYDQFQLGNWPFRAAAAFVLMTTTLVLTALTNLWMHRSFRR